MASILQCQNCGGELKVLGKKGAYLQTECLDCGATSAPMVNTYLSLLANREQQKSAKYLTKTPEIINRPQFRAAEIAPNKRSLGEFVKRRAMGE